MSASPSDLPPSFLSFNDEGCLSVTPCQVPSGHGGYPSTAGPDRPRLGLPQRGTGTHLAAARSKLRPYDVSVFTALIESPANVASGKARKRPLPSWPLEIGSLQESVLASLGSATSSRVPLAAEEGGRHGPGIDLMSRPRGSAGARTRP
jgi:hypothetical protein